MADRSFRAQYAFKANMVVVIVLMDIALNAFCDYNDKPNLPRWYPAVVLG